jgi:hypothetical protein
MRHIGIPIAVLALAACASAKTGGGEAPYVTTDVKPQVLQAGGNTYDLTTTESKDVMSAPIFAPMDSVWNVLGSIFLDLGIEPVTVDPTLHYMANTSFQVRATLGGVAISHYLDCGSGLNGPVAQQAQLSMSLTVQVIADSSKVSALKSQVTGFAVQRGLQAQKVECASTGQLESRIARMASDAVKHGAKN